MTKLAQSLIIAVISVINLGQICTANNSSAQNILSHKLAKAIRRQFFPASESSPTAIYLVSTDEQGKVIKCLLQKSSVDKVMDKASRYAIESANLSGMEDAKKISFKVTFDWHSQFSEYPVGVQV
jgi:hypothetical protein